jgi:hypothetical protein
MATQTTTNKVMTSINSSAFERFASVCAVLVGAGGLAYAIAFLVVKNALFSDLFLMLSGFFSTAFLVALYNRVRERDFALWGLLLGIAGALGSIVHGAYDLSNVVNPITLVSQAAAAGIPNAIDPRGILTFAAGGIGLFVLVWLLGQSGQFPRILVYVGYLAAALLIILYLGRLIIYIPTNPLILIPAALSGFLVNPLWYIWSGFILWHSRK